MYLWSSFNKEREFFGKSKKKSFCKNSFTKECFRCVKKHVLIKKCLPYWINCIKKTEIVSKREIGLASIPEMVDSVNALILTWQKNCNGGHFWTTGNCAWSYLFSCHGVIPDNARSYSAARTVENISQFVRE